MFSRIYLILIPVVVLVSCKKKPEHQEAFYNVDSLINAQVKLLSARKTSMKKTAVLDGKQSLSTLELKDSLGWENELAVFREIDMINKPINRYEYVMKDGIPDTKSNLSIKSVTTTDTKLPVEYIQLFYHQVPQKIKRIEAHFRESNSLYTSSRYLTLEFQEIHEEPILTHYTIRGGQKMFMSDSVQYTIQASITIPD